VLSVGCTAAIAEEQDLPSALKGFRDDVRGIDDLVTQGLGKMDPQLRPFAKSRNDVCKRGVPFHVALSS
jgi:hypothetical protein